MRGALLIIQMNQISKKGVSEMEMRVILCCLVLFCLSLALLNCATIPIKPLSQSNIPELAGK